MTIDDMRSLYVENLKDLYSAEQQLTKALTKLIDAASSPDLREAFQGHLDETEGHVNTVRGLIEDLQENPEGEECVGMKGLIQEADHVLKMATDKDVKDAAIIGAAQKAEHYEIAGYGTVRTYSMHLGLDEHTEQLQGILDQEYAADDKLTQIAESGVNREAMEPSRAS